MVFFFLFFCFFFFSFSFKNTLAIQAKMRESSRLGLAAGKMRRLRTQPASFVPGARADTPRPPHRGGASAPSGLSPPLPARADPGRGARRDAPPRCARIPPDARHTVPPRRRAPIPAQREGRKTNNKTWLLVPSGNRGPAGSDEGEVVRSAGSQPALPARLPELPERSGAARRPPHLSSRRAPARSPARARPRHRPAPPPAPPRPVQSGPSRGLRVAAGRSPAWVSLRAERAGRLQRAWGPRSPQRRRRERAAARRGRTVLYVTWSRLHRLGGLARLEEARFGRRICVPPLLLRISGPGSLWPWDLRATTVTCYRVAVRQSRMGAKRKKN